MSWHDGLTEEVESIFEALSVFDVWSGRFDMYTAGADAAPSARAATRAAQDERRRAERAASVALRDAQFAAFVALVIAAHEDGYSYAQIARASGRSLNAVGRILRQHSAGMTPLRKNARSHREAA